MLSGLYARLALIGGALLALALAVLRIFNAGKKAERGDNAIKGVENANARTQVDVDVAGADSTERDKLRRKWTTRP